MVIKGYEWLSISYQLLSMVIGYQRLLMVINKLSMGCWLLTSYQ